MKFKKDAIKPGMVIHCQKEEDARALLKHLESLGYKWINGKKPSENSLPAYYGYYRITNDELFSLNCGVIEEEITEFSDLIEPDDSPINSDTDSPMTAKEFLEWLTKYRGKIEIKECFGRMYAVDILLNHFTAEEIIDKIATYEAAKKAPKPVEVEWVDICRIIQIQDNGVKKCVYEEVLKPETPFDTDPDLKEQSEAILKKYISEHEGRYFAVMEGVCRVKGES